MTSGDRRSSIAPDMVADVHGKHSFQSVEVVISDGCMESSELYLLLAEGTQTCARSQTLLRNWKISHEEATVAALEGAGVEIPPWQRFLDKRVNIGQVNWLHMQKKADDCRSWS